MPIRLHYVGVTCGVRAEFLHSPGSLHCGYLPHPFLAKKQVTVFLVWSVVADTSGHQVCLSHVPTTEARGEGEVQSATFIRAGPTSACYTSAAGKALHRARPRWFGVTCGKRPAFLHSPGSLHCGYLPHLFLATKQATVFLVWSVATDTSVAHQVLGNFATCPSSMVRGDVWIKGRVPPQPR